MNKINESIIKTIEMTVLAYLKKVGYDKPAFVLGSDTDGNVSVIIDKQNYKVKNGTNILFSEGDRCLVHYINGNSQQKVIIAKL